MVFVCDAPRARAVLYAVASTNAKVCRKSVAAGIPQREREKERKRKRERERERESESASFRTRLGLSRSSNVPSLDLSRPTDSSLVDASAPSVTGAWRYFDRVDVDGSGKSIRSDSTEFFVVRTFERVERALPTDTFARAGFAILRMRREQRNVDATKRQTPVTSSM